MKTQKDIEEAAKKSYEAYFKDHEETRDDAYRGHDVVLDKDQLEGEMQVLKEKEERKEESLEELKESITEKAEASFNKTFKD